MSTSNNISAVNHFTPLKSGVGFQSALLGTSSVPTPSDYQKTGFVHCVMKREGVSNRLGLFADSKIRFSIENAEGAELQVLVAQNDAPHQYSIYSVAESGKVGSLVRVQSSFSSIRYALLDRHDHHVAAFFYIVPSVTEVLRDAPPRQAQVALYTAKIVEEDDHKTFGHLCKESIQKHGNLKAMAEHTNMATILENKKPYTKTGGRVGLNFQGRGRETSPKNMQLVEIKSNQVKIQMAKWDHQVYNVDFCAPFTIMYAFAFALAQLDL